MNKEEIKKLKEKLLSEKKLIEENMKRFESELDFGDDTDHMEEEADEVEEMTNYLSVKDNQDKRLKQIEVALERIENGTYGICDKCGGKIEKEILEIDPESMLCKKCKMSERR
ncbi:hypothetical protein M1506_01995 [Patescibacteria group bacterium]|nr:hypothetical protein [Patescibacteria group bacterium]